MNDELHFRIRGRMWTLLLSSLLPYVIANNNRYYTTAMPRPRFSLVMTWNRLLCLRSVARYDCTVLWSRGEEIND